MCANSLFPRNELILLILYLVSASMNLHLSLIYVCSPLGKHNLSYHPFTWFIICCLCWFSILYMIYSLFILYFRTKAARAKKLLQKKQALREEKRAALLAAGVDWQSEDSEGETPVVIISSVFLLLWSWWYSFCLLHFDLFLYGVWYFQRKEIQEPPLPGLLTNEENCQLVIDVSSFLLAPVCFMIIWFLCFLVLVRRIQKSYLNWRCADLVTQVEVLLSSSPYQG